MDKSTILLVEDEQAVADIIIKGLQEEKAVVLHAKSGDEGLRMLQENKIHLVVLDILLPNINGLEVCKNIRSLGYLELPILMLTALGSAENVVLGLDAGADDYLSKPFKLIELKARIRSLLRRSDLKDATVTKNDENTYRFADIVLDDTMKSVTRAGQEISLTSTEYRLLLMFMKNPRRVLSRTDLLDEVWGIDFNIGTNVVDVYVNYLRKKISQYGDEKLIHTVIGMGYILKED